MIICFAEEMWSSLFRTVWSVLDRTPDRLLEEIILVNDASTAFWLQGDLKAYVATLPSKVRLIKSDKRLGLAFGLLFLIVIFVDGLPMRPTSFLLFLFFGNRTMR